MFSSTINNIQQFSSIPRLRLLRLFDLLRTERCCLYHNSAGSGSANETTISRLFRSVIICSRFFPSEIALESIFISSSILMSF